MDLTCSEAARFFERRCADHYPVSDRYLALVHDSPDKSGRTEREHMISWFAANQTLGSGGYTRQAANTSARRCYQRLQNAASLLWIAEACGVDGALVEKAYRAASEAGDRRRVRGHPAPHPVGTRGAGHRARALAQSRLPINRWHSPSDRDAMVAHLFSLYTQLTATV